MWNDTEIDMEELESRLYGQVHHPGYEDVEPTSNLSNKAQQDLGRNHNRYFNGNKLYQSPYGFRNTHHGYQRFSNDNRTYFQTGENFDLHQRASIYNPMGLVALPEFVLNPAVNNIVVLPQPPTQIFMQDKTALRSERRREKSKNKRREKRKLAREAKRKLAREEKRLKTKQNQKAFKEHYLTSKIANLDHNSSNKSLETSKAEIICLSESDSSDCVAEANEPPIVFLSSGDEVDHEKLEFGDSAIEIKNESNIKIDNNDNQKFRLESTSEPVKVSLDMTKTENNNARLENVQSGMLIEDDDDDVVFVDSGQNNFITINCEDSQSLIDINNSTAASPTQNNMSVIINQLKLDKKHPELVDTPESTNDFLDGSFTSSQNNFEALDGNNVSSEKSCINEYETDSNCSGSEFDAPSRSALFTEQEFDAPSQETFSELNLDSFTSYIASKASSSIPSILTPAKKLSVSKGNKYKVTASRNSSDSSSESDYDDKVNLVQNCSKAYKISLADERSSSESDDCVVSNENEIENVKDKTLLPNLSPITSDEEVNPKENTESNKNQKKKLKNATNSICTSGEKRKSSQDVEEVAEIKKMKHSNENLNESKNKEQQTDKYFSSSDEFSDVEVVQIDSKSDHSDIELLNLGITSTPIKQSREEPKDNPKKFSDYWTDDMEKFYRESWGHENFSVEEEQKRMSDDPNQWKIINRDYIHIKLSSKGPRCNRCREFGHKFNVCTKKIGPPKCILCGARGHLEARCPNKMCTSCGRRSQYSTTYCSRCANSRHVRCKICSMYGHTASYCTDLWRRYHLTTKDGPLERPSSSTSKPPKDRWCSGCGSRGHFEFNCNYYNRTHPPTNPTIHNYKDIYEKRRSREQTSDYLMQSREENKNYYNRDATPPHSSQVSPWIFGSQPNTYGHNFIHPYGSNPNFYQQFSVFQSVPNLFGLQQNLNNIFYPNSNLVSMNRSVQDQYVSNPGPITNQDDSFVRRDADSSASKDFVGKSIESIESQFNGITNPVLDKNQKRDYLKLKDLNAHKLLNKDGVAFLKKFSNVTIKIIKRKKNKKVNYWCMIDGPKNLVPTVKQSINCYCKSDRMMQFEAAPLDIVGTFKGKYFNMQVLQESLSKMDNPDTNWLKLSSNLYKKILNNHKKINTAKTSSQLDKVKEIEDAMKNQYVALNAVLMGKANVKDGSNHMKILNQAAHGGDAKDVNDETVQESYNYVFRNFTKLNVNYRSAIRSLPCNVSLKTEIDRLFESGSAICKNNNMKDELSKLTSLYDNVIYCNYSRRKINMFKTLHDTIVQNNAQ